MTKRFELWGDARTSYNAPTRWKRDKKAHILLAAPKNPDRKVKVPYSEYSAPMVFYKMHRAEFLEDLHISRPDRNS